MTDRDRLIELTTIAHKEWLQKEYDHETDKNVAEYLVDYLLANGVVFAIDKQRKEDGKSG